MKTKAHPLVIPEHAAKNAEESNVGCVAYKERKDPNSLHTAHLGMESKGEAVGRGSCWEQTLNSSGAESLACIPDCLNYCRGSVCLSCLAGIIGLIILPCWSD
uniref:Uncharacterized protein n=1 Tax=Micrurus spixii TaxID=129469 RepID=A0A2D4MNA9_9SAUR